MDTNDPYLAAAGLTRDRRKSPRVPLTKPVKVGPPGGVPQSLVSAADLSAGGLFIDAERPVRVGARFCVRVPLADGKSAYVDEAEVIYNRQSTSASGFGVRFTRVKPASKAAIRKEVERLSVAVVPSEAPADEHESVTIVPAAFGGDVAVHPAGLGDEVEGDSKLGPPAEEEEADVGFDDALVPSWRSEATGGVWKRARRIGLVLGALGAVAVLLVTVVFLWSAPTDGDPMVTESGPAPAASPDTHLALINNEPPATEVVPEPKRPVEEKKRRPLPGPSRIDRIRAPAPPASARKTRGRKTDRFEFDVARGARVKRSMIYRAPERFVIDLTGQPSLLAVPGRTIGRIRRFRVGRHPTFIRLVLDAERRIKKATATIRSNKLKVAVTYR